MHYPPYHRFTATILLFFCTLLLQSCGSNFHSIIEECTPKKPHKLGAHEPGSGQALAVASGSLPPGHRSDAQPGSFASESPAELSESQPPAVLPIAVRGVVLASSHKPLSVSATRSTPPSSTRDAVSNLDVQPPSRLFTASSGERVLFRQVCGQWQAVLQGSQGAYAHKRTLPVVSAEDAGTFLARLQGQDVWASRSRIHLMTTAHPPYTPCVYLGKSGLLGGHPPEAETWLPGPSITLSSDETRIEVCHIPPGYRYKGYRLQTGSVIQHASSTIRYVASYSQDKIDQLRSYKDGDSLEAQLTADFGTVVDLGTLGGGVQSSSIMSHQAAHSSRFTHAALVIYASTKQDNLLGQESIINVALEICVEKDGASLPSGSLQDAVSLSKPFQEPSMPPQQPSAQEQIAQQEAQAEPAETSIPTMAIGSAAWEQYFGAVGPEPPLPADIDNILDGPCPFWPGKCVKDTHLLVLIPKSVGGRPFTLNMLEELIRSPKGGGYGTEYSYYSTTVKESLGDQPSGGSYWVLMTRDVLPNSRNKTYEAQKAMVAAHAARESLPYALPHVLEAATAVLLHYAHTGERLYTDDPWTYTLCQGKVKGGHNQYSSVVGGFSSGGLDVYHYYDIYFYFGVSCLRKFKVPLQPSQQAIGSAAWEQYFGAVGPEPPLPADINEILNSSCPFWPGKRVKDTHVLVLIPKSVGGRPFTLDLLGELIRSSKGGGYRTEYSYYSNTVREALGAQPSGRSYWVLMTRDVLPNSRSKTYEAQKEMVAAHAAREHLPYELPHVLEAATALLLHYAHTGERLHTDAPWTYTRCQEKVKAGNHQYSSLIGGFSSRGLGIHYTYNAYYSYHGVSCLRKFTMPLQPSQQAIGSAAWEQYFGAVGPEPPLPADINEILNSACPFWPGKRVKETHLLVLIPESVGGRPFTLNLLQELIRSPKGGGYGTAYSYYSNTVKEALGDQPSGRSYWVLMTRGLLLNSRGKTYKAQKAMVAAHAAREHLPYELPHVLEAATALLLHYAHTGERLYTDTPWTYTLCQEQVKAGNNQYSFVVGGFSSGGLFVSHDDHDVFYYSFGVSCLRKF